MSFIGAVAGLVLVGFVVGVFVYCERVAYRLQTSVVLELLASSHESYGLDLVRRSGGRLKRGAVYVTLGRMEEEGLVASRSEPVTPSYIGVQRRLYRLTDRGLAAWRSAASAAERFR
jgi:DNA-binding PadR family transcriptional regulator